MDVGRQQHVAQQLVARFRQRERNGAFECLHAHVAVFQFGNPGVLEGQLAAEIFEAEVPVAGIHRDSEGLRVLAQQRFLPIGQACGMLLHVLRRDREQRLLSGIGVDMTRAHPGELNSRRGP
ncbi:hypothetical protein D3C76_949020 [compost metagenome]